MEAFCRRRLFLVLVYREKISLIYDVSPLLTLPLIVSLLLCPFHCYRVIYGFFLQISKFFPVLETADYFREGLLEINYGMIITRTIN